MVLERQVNESVLLCLAIAYFSQRLIRLWRSLRLSTIEVSA